MPAKIEIKEIPFAFAREAKRILKEVEEECGGAVAGIAVAESVLDVVILLDDLGRRAGIRALGEFLGWEEFGVATVAVAGAEEVEEAVLGDVDGFGYGWVGWPIGA